MHVECDKSPNHLGELAEGVRRVGTYTQKKKIYYIHVRQDSACRIRIRFQRRVAIYLKMGNKVELGALNTNMASVLTQV